MQSTGIAQRKERGIPEYPIALRVIYKVGSAGFTSITQLFPPSRSLVLVLPSFPLRSFIMAVLFRLLFAVAVLPFVFAGSESCGDNEFMYEAKSCCVPFGGTPAPPSPPTGVQCPPSGWEWHEGKQCCIPHQPPANMPPPQCNMGWDWNEPSSTCCESGGGGWPGFPMPPPPKPSSAPWGKRHGKSRTSHD